MKKFQSKTILITGLGALGTVFGTLLKKQGHAVFGLTRERYLPALRERRTRVSGIWGEHEAVFDGIESEVGPFSKRSFDLILITVKSYDTATAIEQVKPLVGPDTLVVLAQNGLGNYEIVSDAVGAGRTLLSRVIFGAKLHAPGSAEVTVIADDVRIGQPENAVERSKIQEIADILDAAGIPTAFAENIQAILWDKVLYNAALNPLGAILECTYGELAENKETRQVMDAIIEEVFGVAQAHGVKLNWMSAEKYCEHFYARLVPPTARHFPSMYYDMKAGKRLEIDALNGAIVRLARKKNISVPINETITRLIKAKGSLAGKHG